MSAPEEPPGTPPYPRATYRLQLNKDFRFEDACRIVPYLAALGISHVYLSPILMARPGSIHGYDIVDHNRLNPEIGEAQDFDRMLGELHRHGMGLILDFVPNHMFVGPDNDWWMDILEWGKSSRYASYVDIDWDPLEPSNAGKVLLPVLGDHYGAVLERGELELRFDDARGAFVVGYFDNIFPISPRDYPMLLQRACSVGAEPGRLLEPLVADAVACLRLRGTRRQRADRYQRIAALKGRLAELAADDAAGRALRDAAMSLNGRSGQPATFDALHRLLERQSYRLAFWRVAAHEINYRRFFDINELIGLRMEQPDLFEISHRLAGRLIAEGKIQGLRLDHVDGLRNPKQYLARLQALAGARARRSSRRSTGTAQPFYTVVEKILAPDENLRSDWAVSGTTGYEFMAQASGLFVDPSGENALTQCYEQFIGRPADYPETVEAAKRQIMRQTLASELLVLANAFARIAKRNRHTRDYTVVGLRDALEDVIACFPVYRTYVTVRGAGEEDRRVIVQATDAARAMARTPDTTIYAFIRDVLTLDLLKRGRGSYVRQAVTNAALKFQQYTGPVMAKSVEDTAFYRYLRLVSLNDVGGEPDRFGLSPDTFHEASRKRQARFPLSLIATATHDHKRGEDVRARLNVLSEMPSAWAEAIRRWADFNAGRKKVVSGRRAPGPNDEYLFYQTVVGAWPLDVTVADARALADFSARIGAYMLKAVREAKVHTSWAAPNEPYEAALAGFVDGALDRDLSGPFLDDIAAFANRIAPAGAVNGLAQTVLKLTAPGVPDIYQGTELWDFSLVDPDNRRPVSYEIRARQLEQREGADLEALSAQWRNGAIKQYLIGRVLALRQAVPALFAQGNYMPLGATGPAAGHVLAFAREFNGEAVVTVVPRLAGGKILDGEALRTCGWEGTGVILKTQVTHGRPRSLFSQRDIAVASDGSLSVADLFGELPVAVLHWTQESR